MKKIKQMRIKAILLTIVAVLTLGFTSCTDELASDQTQGKPGYLTLNLKTIQPKHTKSSADLSNDYTVIKDLNVLIFRGENLLIKKHIIGTHTNGTSVSINVGELNTTTDKVVVVANHVTAIDVATLTALKALEIPTVGDFSTTGLPMTGIADITTTDGLAFASNVKIAPIVSKISVNWTASGDAAFYNITGVYIVNAISKTKLPIVLHNGLNDAPANIALLTPTNKTASSGYAVTSSTIARDYNIYSHTAITTPGILRDAVVTGALPMTFGTTLYSYYVGENYHAALPAPTGSGPYTPGGSLFADQTANNNSNANTIILIEATPKAVGEDGTPAWIANGGVRYYTYDLNASLAATGSISSPNAIAGAATTGFSTKRKTNYVVSFGLTNPGTTNPFARISTLAVTVTATAWDDAPTSTTF